MTHIDVLKILEVFCKEKKIALQINTVRGFLLSGSKKIGNTGPIT